MPVTLATLEDLSNSQVEHRRDKLYHLIKFYAKHEPRSNDHMSALRGFRSCVLLLDKRPT
jgi:hypothetical protein